ncbi:DNA topoisomerase III [Maricurvus nonylphenolicus]|uniref:DNA topoisomerase III n=1 Tax=Maricurvus nonylphenolicus TaxID=1008307 RepID=UPI0036F2DF51
MILYIAEKPSLGRAIADGLSALNGLPKARKGEGCLELANGDVVSWCIGHLLEQAEPDAYDPAYKAWKHETLPIIPQQWKLQPKPKTRKQFTVLKKLIKKADHLVHAGDPDREGQLLVDEVINYAGVSEAKRGSVQRCLISDLNGPAVQQALRQMRPNREFMALSVSALARSRADWLYGINMTRAYTLQGKTVGYQGVLSVGRVQTPLLGLVVRRDLEIEAFQPHPYFDVWASCQNDDKQTFKAKWQPSEHCQDYLDEQGRNLSRPLAENVAGRIVGQPAEVTSYKVANKKQAPPLPHSLSSLQIDASKAFGMSAQQVLDICQALYERHKVVTYPRSDSRHLPVEHHRQAGDVMRAVTDNLQSVLSSESGLGFGQALESANFSQKSKAWNDSKVDAHHAIIPTQARSKSLNANELKVYQLICRNYLAQFLSHYQFEDAKAEITIAGGVFVAKAKKPLEMGWKIMFPVAKKGSAASEGEDADQFNRSGLPGLQKGQILTCIDADIVDKQTTPPKPFTDATLLAAMTGISRFVGDPALRQVLKETDGLGTEATRAGIMELLFKRGFLTRQGKSIRATPAGKGFIQALPESATLPDMTARWESQLTAISERLARYDDLMLPLQQELQQLVVQSQQVVPLALKGLSSGKPAYKRKRKGNKGTTTRKKTATAKS